MVDDDPGIRSSLTKRLQEADFRVQTAADGDEGIRKASSRPPDLILLDIQLPVLDGFRVLEELKKRKVNTRVIMFSGQFTDVDTAIKCIKNGACDYLCKPVHLEDLICRMRRALLVETTLNLRISDLPPIVEQLISETEHELTRLKAENAALKRQHLHRDVCAKLALVVLALAATLAMVHMRVFNPGATASGVFLALILLLLIPTDRLKNISAQLLHFRTRIGLK